MGKENQQACAITNKSKGYFILYSMTQITAQFHLLSFSSFSINYVPGTKRRVPPTTGSGVNPTDSDSDSEVFVPAKKKGRKAIQQQRKNSFF